MNNLVAKIVLLLLIAAFAAEAQATNVAVVMSSDAPAYQEALEGFRETTRHQIVGEQILKKDPATWRDDINTLRAKIAPDLVFVIGTAALQAVAGEITTIPIVHAMVFNPLGITPSAGKNIVGIGMSPSADQLIPLLKEL